MVVKTDLCNFSEWKIYPGKGIRFVAKDGKPYLFLSKRNRNFSIKFIFYYVENSKPKDLDGLLLGEDFIKKLNRPKLAKLKEREMIEENKKELLKVLLLIQLINLRTPKLKTKKHWLSKLLDKSRRERKLKLPKDKEIKKQ
jgi:hypothetical protein